MEGNAVFTNWERAFDYISKISEDELISMQYLMKKNAELDLPFLFGQIGRWWGNNPVKKRQEEIDIIAADDKMQFFVNASGKMSF
ncbi:DUF234 domain-containing protein [Dethiosulfatibacter aminovorans]|uniref:DUF234 domain-containing protein n=1 Tax=Dethiosulfatibacter aminovorans TaxID=332095 RepID=UPI002482CBC1|nr:DUF234 domain-containing protein [Dethiosulfatibacter aminovorans]